MASQTASSSSSSSNDQQVAATATAGLTSPYFQSYQQVLFSSIVFHTRDMLLSMTLGTIYIPFDRVATLMTVEGELKRQGLLPHQGFGGIRACWLQLWEREGVMGCMRSSLLTPVLRFPTRLIGDVYSTSFCHFFYSSFLVEPILVMVVAMVTSVCVTAPYNILQRLLRTVHRADLKTKAKPSSGETPPLGATASSSSFVSTVARTWRQKLRTWWSGRSDVQYHYTSILQAAKSIGRQLHWRSCVSMMVLEMVYKNVFMWLFPIILNLVPFVANSFWGRGFTLALRDVLMQPFRVVMGRMAVSCAFSENNNNNNSNEGGEGEKAIQSGGATNRRAYTYTSVWQCIQTIYEDDGVKGLWAGLRYRLLLSSLAWFSVLIAPPAVPEGGQY